MLAEERVQAISDLAISLARCVLVDERRPLVVMSHARHQIPKRDAHVGGECVAGVPEVVEVQAGHPHGAHDVDPAGQFVEAATPQRAALDPREDERVIVVLRVLRKVCGQVRDDARGDAHRPPTGTGLGRTKKHLPVVLFGIGKSHAHGAGGEVDVAALERGHFPPPKACECGKQHERPEAIIKGGVCSSVLRQIPQHSERSRPSGEGALNIDYVIVDMGPSLGSLNQNIVCTSDLVFVPTSPDFFSVMALKSLARILPRWDRWADAASQNDVLRTATYSFPRPRLKYAGAVIQRYRLYRSPTEENPFGDPTRPFQEWIDRVSSSLKSDFIPALDEAGLLLDKEEYSKLGIGDDLVLGRIQEFNSLLPKSQEHRLPVFALTPSELNQAGVVLDGSM
jgi:hypothetical protein